MVAWAFVVGASAEPWLIALQQSAPGPGAMPEPPAMTSRVLSLREAVTVEELQNDEEYAPGHQLLPAVSKNGSGLLLQLLWLCRLGAAAPTSASPPEILS